MLQEYLFRYSLPRPLAPRWVGWFRISLSHSRGQVDKRYGQQGWSQFPNSTNGWGGGLPTVSGGGGFSGPEDKADSDRQPYPAMLYEYMSLGLHEINFWIDAMNTVRFIQGECDILLIIMQTGFGLFFISKCALALTSSFCQHVVM